MAYNRGRFEQVGGLSSSPDLLYYNCDIINNNSKDLGVLQNAVSNLALTADPQIRFNETCDTALIKDVSEYEFSIIRFTMNGANRDLPLFIPNILLGQNNPNLTTYAVAVSYQQTWNTNLGAITFNITPLPTFIIYVPEVKNDYLAPTPRTPLITQDLSSRYYWVFTYQHWIDLVNQTLLTAHQTLYTTFQAQWAGYAGLTDPFPFATFNAFQATVQTPRVVYDENNRLFTLYGDSDGYGQRLTTFTPIPYVAGTASPQTQPRERLFFNTNMAGMFANFNTIYWNVSTIPSNTIDGVVYPAFPVNNVPEGYVYELIFSNKFYKNVADYRVPPESGIPPLGYVPLSAQKVYWELTQDFKSVDTLWSPISSLVFTTTLLPIKTEQASAPNILGSSNLGDSAPTTLSAFDPIITDIALDTAAGGADLWRQFIYYTPIAEYRMTDMSPSRQELRNIDIQVFWKNRLDSQLYPVYMYNLSSVSIKIMFRKKHM
jgi:hypothetical protein